jgi:hypothetical protein
VKDLIYNIFKQKSSYPALELCHYFLTRNSSAWYNKCDTTLGMYGVDAADKLIEKVVKKSADSNPDVIIVNGDLVAHDHAAESTDNETVKE